MYTVTDFRRDKVAFGFNNKRKKRPANFNGSAMIDGMLRQVSSGGGYDAKFVLRTTDGIYPVALTTDGKVVVYDAAWAAVNKMPAGAYLSDMLDTQIATLSDLTNVIGVGTASSTLKKIEPGTGAINYIGNGWMADSGVEWAENKATEKMLTLEKLTGITPPEKKAEKEIIGMVVTAIVIIVLFVWGYKTFTK
jgi:hypothetical protein